MATRDEILLNKSRERLGDGQESKGGPTGAPDEGHAVDEPQQPVRVDLGPATGRAAAHASRGGDRHRPREELGRLDKVHFEQLALVEPQEAHGDGEQVTVALVLFEFVRRTRAGRDLGQVHVPDAAGDVQGQGAGEERVEPVEKVEARFQVQRPEVGAQDRQVLVQHALER